MDSLIDFAGGASLVLLGEASHGTHEFYATRAEITKRLIREKGFNAVAAEADWPDAHRVIGLWWVEASIELPNKGYGDSRASPWMWRNDVVAEFATWLRNHNQQRPFPSGV